MKHLHYTIAILLAIFSSCKDPSDSFVGTWTDLNAQNGNIRKITISKLSKTQVLVDFDQRQYAGYFDGRSLWDLNGSFKETGQITENTIVVNPYLKLSLIENNSRLLLNGKEFIRSDGNDIAEAKHPTAEEIRQSEEKRIQDSIEAAQRMADSLAAMEAVMMPVDR